MESGLWEVKVCHHFRIFHYHLRKAVVLVLGRYSIFLCFMLYVLLISSPSYRFLLWAPSKFVQQRGSHIRKGIIPDFGSSNIYKDNDDYLAFHHPHHLLLAPSKFVQLRRSTIWWGLNPPRRLILPLQDNDDYESLSYILHYHQRQSQHIVHFRMFSQATRWLLFAHSHHN